MIPNFTKLQDALDLFKDELESKIPGKYILGSNDRFVGVFDTYNEAHHFAREVERMPEVSFVIYKVEAKC